MSCKGLEFSTCVSPAAMHRPRQPAALSGARISAGIDPEFVGVTPPLSNGTLGCIHCHSVAVMGN